MKGAALLAALAAAAAAGCTPQATDAHGSPFHGPRPSMDTRQPLDTHQLWSLHPSYARASKRAASQTAPGSLGEGPDAIETTDQAWAELAAGRYSKAQWYFAREVRRTESSGEPKIGYAIAVAGMGDLSHGVWAMRRALQTEPDALFALPLDDELAASIRAVRHQYQARLEEKRDADSALMVAALHGALGDMQAARQALDFAAARGDLGPSARNLARALDERLPACGLVAPPPPPPASSAPPPIETAAATEAPAALAAPPQPQPRTPREPIDYDKLRADITEVAGALERFNGKLMESLHRIAAKDK